MGYQRDYNRRIRAGVVGVGDHSYRNILPTLHYLPVELRAVCDMNGGLAEKTAVEYGCRSYERTAEMYEKEDLEAVFICVGPRQHPQLVLEALDAGLHVWVEKPVATRAAQVEEMMAHRKDQVVVVGLKKAFMPAAYKALEVINSRDYGCLRSILAVYPMSMEADGAALLERQETPNWLRNGVHPISLMMRLCGPVESVTAIRGPMDNGVVALQFVSGVMGTLHMADGAKPDREMYGIYGEGWSMQIEDAVLSLQRGIPFVYQQTDNYAPPGFDGGKLVWAPGNCVATLENKALFTQGFYNETSYFCNCLLTGKQPQEGTLEFAYDIMRVYEAALLSEGRAICLDQ